MTIVPKFFKKQVEFVKENVDIADVAERYTELRRAGSGRLVGRCVAPDHPDKTPSMVVYPDTGRFRCFGCGAGGDVLDLVMLAEGHEEVWTALISLATRYGIQLPERPASWFKRQRRRRPVVDGLVATLAASYRRRWFRILMPVLDGATEEEAREVWDALLPLAVERAERRLIERGIKL